MSKDKLSSELVVKISEKDKRWNRMALDYAEEKQRAKVLELRKPTPWPVIRARLWSAFVSLLERRKKSVVGLPEETVVKISEEDKRWNRMALDYAEEKLTVMPRKHRQNVPSD
jgi:hypothetical protein